MLVLDNSTRMLYCRSQREAESSVYSRKAKREARRHLIRRTQNSMHDPPTSYSASSSILDVHPECEEQTISMKVGSSLFELVDADESSVECDRDGVVEVDHRHDLRFYILHMSATWSRNRPIPENERDRETASNNCDKLRFAKILLSGLTRSRHLSSQTSHDLYSLVASNFRDWLLE